MTPSTSPRAFEARKTSCAGSVKRERASESITAEIRVSWRGAIFCRGLTNWEEEYPRKDHQGNMGVDDSGMLSMSEVSVRVFLVLGWLRCVADMAHSHVHLHVHAITVAMRKNDRQEG